MTCILCRHARPGEPDRQSSAIVYLLVHEVLGFAGPVAFRRNLTTDPELSALPHEKRSAAAAGRADTTRADQPGMVRRAGAADNRGHVAGAPGQRRGSPKRPGRPTASRTSLR